MMATGRRLEVLISREELRGIVARLGAEITSDCAGQRLVVVGVLRGAFVFLADLVRELDLPIEVDFIRVASYAGTHSTGKVKMAADLDTDVAGRPVLLVEDIVDTGRTTEWLLRHFRAKGAASVRICTLLDKAEMREVPVKLDYTGKVIPNKFVVGYGLDVDQELRQLPAIYVVT